MFSKLRNMSLVNKIRLIILLTLLPLLVLVVITIYMFDFHTRRYDAVVDNLTEASNFNFDFQDKMDYSVYRYIIGIRDDMYFEPFIEIEKARTAVEKLEKNASNEKGTYQIKMVNKFLTNIETAITKIIEGEGSYDAKIQILEGVINPNTELVSDWMYQYIYTESLVLVEIGNETRENVQNSIIIIIITTFLLVMVLMFFSINITNSITRPVRELSENIVSVGKGNFSINPVKTSNDEIQTLGKQFELMVEQIEILMTDIKTEEENLRMTELKLLQAQINPHFLYNTLDTIVWLAEDEQSQEVVKMVTSLSNFFRTSLSKGEDHISINEEEMHVRSYLEIQAFRYSDVMSYTINISDSIHGYEIPKLTLQPLVENALYHGIKLKRGGGSIKIVGAKFEGKIILTIFDNGVGMDKEKLQELRDSLKNSDIGYGLSNVYQRLKLFYRDDCEITINSKENKYTMITMKIKP